MKIIIYLNICLFLIVLKLKKMEMLYISTNNLTEFVYRDISPGLRISNNNLTEFVYRDISKSKNPIKERKVPLPPSYEEIEKDNPPSYEEIEKETQPSPSAPSYEEIQKRNTTFTISTKL